MKKKIIILKKGPKSKGFKNMEYHIEGINPRNETLRKIADQCNFLPNIFERAGNQFSQWGSEERIKSMIKIAKELSCVDPSLL